jgi:TolB protein
MPDPTLCHRNLLPQRAPFAPRLCALIVCLFPPAARADSGCPVGMIGYTQFRTNIPESRHANVVTMRAVVSHADGTCRRILAEELAREQGAWTQFAGFSPDGKAAIVGRGWESDENARWEEEHKTFRFTSGGWLYDMFLVDLTTGEAFNVTGVDRVSNYNTGLFFWPGNDTRLGFQAIIDGNSHPFRMDLDGHNKQDLTTNSQEFAYGFSGSPDGKRIAYHMNYKIYIADADGSNARLIDTGKPFNFVPQWSADGAHLLFVAGAHYDCHPHVVLADGTGLRKLADLAGYRGVVEFLDVPDFHGGSSDVPKWDIAGKSVIYTAKVGKNVELFQISLEGTVTQLTCSPEGWSHYHPQPSPDGHWLAYGSKRDGVRQLYVRRLADGCELRLTDFEPGHAAMWLHWQPASNAVDR